MGKVAGVKRGRGGRSRSKGKDSDDSDEDYMIEDDEDYIDEEDEDKLFSNEEDENDDDEGEGEEQHFNDLSDHNDGFKEEIEEEGFCKTAQLRRKRSGLPQMKLGVRISNIQRNALRRYAESDDENETQTERFRAAEEEEDVNEVTILKRKRSCLEQRKMHSNVSSNRRNAHEEFDDDEDYNVEEVEEEEEEDDDEKEKEKEEQIQKLGVSEEEHEIDEVIRSNLNRSYLDQKRLHNKTSNSCRYRYGNVNDEDYNLDDDEEDEEDDDFTLDESFSLEEEDDEEEEEHVVKKKKQNNKPIKRTSRKKSSGSRRRKKRRAKVSSKVGKKRKESRSVRRTVGSDEDDDCEDEDFININFVRKRRTKKKPRRGTRNFTVHSDSDSDFVDSVPSEIEFTISDEEREQVREASNICRKSTVPLRSSFSYRDSESFAHKRKRLVTKGKEKIPELKKDMVKQVCGICFSEEGKNTVRGALNSCSHYFCFACILEWSKVESRCPLCKQRFQTITKLVKENTGVDSKGSVLQIPERDQVYQPTEEEIRGYLDPYENVMCTECREGGDDELMLLCDLCDSPAHTYCVGLGREVPDGNWYCEGCRPTSLGPSNNQIQDSITGQRNLFHRLSSFEGNRDDFDGSFPTPSTSFPQGFGSFPSPIYLGGGIQAPSPRSGTGVVTVSGRRHIHRQMQFIFSNNRSRQATDALIGSIGDSPQDSQSHSSHRRSSPARTPAIGTSFGTQLYEESCNTLTPQRMQFLPVSSHQLADQLVLDPTPILDEINVNGTSRPSTISTSHNVQPFISNNNTYVGCDYHLSSSTLGEGSNFCLEEQVKHLVQKYLESMSRTLTLGNGESVLEEIERKSQNTILAAYGRYHVPSEVFPIPLQPRCTHIDNPSIHTSPSKDHCISCFTTFAKEVVKTILNSKLPHFLHVRD